MALRHGALPKLVAIFAPNAGRPITDRFARKKLPLSLPFIAAIVADTDNTLTLHLASQSSMPDTKMVLDLTSFLTGPSTASIIGLMANIPTLATLSKMATPLTRHRS